MGAVKKLWRGKGIRWALKSLAVASALVVWSPFLIFPFIGEDNTTKKEVMGFLFELFSHPYAVVKGTIYFVSLAITGLFAAKAVMSIFIFGEIIKYLGIGINETE